MNIPHDQMAPWVSTTRTRIPAGFPAALVNRYTPKKEPGGLAQLTFLRRRSSVLDPVEEFEEDSVIYGVAEGEDQWRQYTVSLGVCDEFAFFNQPRESVAGARPTIGTKGQLILLSSAAPGYMAEVIEEAEPKPGEKPLPQPTPEFQGIRTWYSKTGFFVCRLHYTADLEKRGKQWTGELDPSDPESGAARRGYDLKQWRQEFEIDFAVHAGTPFYPRFSETLHVHRVNAMPNYPIILGFDFGLTPSTMIAQYHPLGFLLILAELVSDGMGIVQHLEELAPLLDSQFPWWREKRSRGSVRPREEEMRRVDMVRSFVDPAGMQRNQVDMTTPMGVLATHGYNPEPSIQDPALRMESVDYFLRTMRKHPQNGNFYPAMIVDPQCKTLIEGLRGGAKQGKNRFSKEKNEYSHPVEALEYITVKLVDGITLQEHNRRTRKSSKPHKQQRLPK